MPKSIKIDNYRASYLKSIEEPLSFWDDIANTFTWYKPWTKTLEWEFETPKVQWFIEGQLNITVNCIDRHLTENAQDIAIIWESNNPNEPNIKLTYQELHDRVCQVANAYQSLGIKKGDRICFYMPMVVELTIGILACARIGAVHSVVFAGFSARALADRIQDCGASLIVCTDVSFRGDKLISIKTIVDDAVAMGCSSVQNILVCSKSDSSKLPMQPLDVLWETIVNQQIKHFEPIRMDSEDPLFILYTSGSTGKPKGVLHTCGGYMIYAQYSFENVFNYHKGDIYWCTADIGWITGHTYIVYGPLLAGATTIMFEGVPTYPDAGRFWQICEKHQVQQFYTAPTAIRALMREGTEFPQKYNLSSLQVIGSVGEPINQEAWEWYHQYIGQSRCPIVDTWWQTETGGIMISPLAVVDQDLKPTFAMKPLPGIQPVLVDVNGKEILENDVEGLLCIQYPWPSIIRTTYGDHDRCRDVYFKPFKGYYFTGDAARRDKDGDYRIIGRVDDVINVSGHRLGTAEIENAINEHSAVIESAVVGYPHAIKGEGIFAYVILSASLDQDQLIKAIKEVVSSIIGPIAKPDIIIAVPGLPKTTSGKIMRRILRKIASDEYDNLGDISTLLNPEIVEQIIMLKKTLE